jgi:DNA-binding PadR family transcriptional regulator
MLLYHAVLGLLAEHPSYGSHLKTSFARAIGPQWGELNIGHLHQILDWLVRDRLVTRKVVQRDRPDKAVYALTELQLQHRDQPLVALLVQASLLHTEANLAVVERVAGDADRIADAAAQLLPEALPRHPPRPRPRRLPDRHNRQRGPATVQRYGPGDMKAPRVAAPQVAA